MITAAGVVLAATFAAAQLPSVELTVVGTAVAVGLLLDTLFVRTVLVPAALLTIGDRVWWPAQPAAPSHSESHSPLIAAQSKSAPGRFPGQTPAGHPLCGGHARSCFGTGRPRSTDPLPQLSGQSRCRFTPLSWSAWPSGR